jgi:SprT protein
MKQKVLNKIEELKTIATEVYGISFEYKEPNITYMRGNSKKIGYFEPKYNTIHFNAKLLEEYGEVYINEVVVHEYAHAIVEILYPWKPSLNPHNNFNIKPHGSEFKSVCEVFGIEGKSTTNLFKNSTILKKKTFPYTCDCTDKIHNISLIRHNKIIKKNASYTCKHCHERIVNSEYTYMPII